MPGRCSVSNMSSSCASVGSSGWWRGGASVLEPWLRGACWGHVDVGLVTELTQEGAKSICRAHPHLLVEQPFTVEHEMHLTQLCVHRAGVRCRMCWICNVSFHVTSTVRIFFCFCTEACGCWIYKYMLEAVLVACVFGGRLWQRSAGRVSVFFQLHQSRCRVLGSSTRVTALCCLCLPLAGGQCLWGDKNRFPRLFSAWSLNSRVPRALWEAEAAETGITDRMTIQTHGVFFEFTEASFLISLLYMVSKLCGNESVKNVLSLS